MKWGEDYPAKHDLSSLRLLGTVGEPINPKARLWYHAVIGGERCPVVNTWWQTETGTIMITTLPGLTRAKPGSAGLPLPGVSAAPVDESGREVAHGSGLLALTRPWPSMLRALYHDPGRYVQTYFGRFGATHRCWRSSSAMPAPAVEGRSMIHPSGTKAALAAARSAVDGTVVTCQWSVPRRACGPWDG